MEGEQQGRQLYRRWQCHSGGGPSTLNWNTSSRAQPYPSRKGEKLKRDELYVICTALPTYTRAIHLFRLSDGQCDASSLSEQNQEETNVKNYMVDLTHFSRFFHPMMYFIHANTRVCLFTEGEGYHTKNEDWSATHKDGQSTRPPFPHPMHIALRMSCHPVVKPQSAMVETERSF